MTDGQIQRFSGTTNTKLALTVEIEGHYISKKFKSKQANYALAYGDRHRY